MSHEPSPEGKNDYRPEADHYISDDFFRHAESIAEIKSLFNKMAEHGLLLKGPQTDYTGEDLKNNLEKAIQNVREELSRDPEKLNEEELEEIFFDAGISHKSSLREALVSLVMKRIKRGRELELFTKDQKAAQVANDAEAIEQAREELKQLFPGQWWYNAEEATVIDPTGIVYTKPEYVPMKDLKDIAIAIHAQNEAAKTWPADIASILVQRLSQSRKA